MKSKKRVISGRILYSFYFCSCINSFICSQNEEKPLPPEIKLHAGGFYVAENKESELRQVDLSKTALRNHYGPKNFKSNGFYVATAQDAAVRAKIDEQYVKAGMLCARYRNIDRIAQPVFNTMQIDDPLRKELKKRSPTTKIDRGRNMFFVSQLPAEEHELKDLCADVANSVRDLILKDRNILESTQTKQKMVLTLLETEAPSRNVATNVMEEIDNQLMHTDVDSKDPHLDEDHMFIGILAIQAGHTAIRVLAKSHLNRMGVAKHIHRIILGRYDYFVAHPKLIHGGCGCMEQNIRLHFYHGLPEEAKEQTFYVKLGEDWGLYKTDNQLAEARDKQTIKRRSIKRLYFFWKKKEWVLDFLFLLTINILSKTT
jgi:hypothetical protein